MPQTAGQSPDSLTAGRLPYGKRPRSTGWPHPVALGPRSLAVGGGLSHNRLFLQQLADIVGLPLYRLAADHHVALGAAALAATAAGHFPSAAEAAACMAPAARCVRPAGDPAVAAFHEAKYAVYHELHRDQCKYRQMMRSAARNVDPT